MSFIKRVVQLTPQLTQLSLLRTFSPYVRHFRFIYAYVQSHLHIVGICIFRGFVVVGKMNFQSMLNEKTFIWKGTELIRLQFFLFLAYYLLYLGTVRTI